MTESRVCVCRGDQRKDGFSGVEVEGALWWVHAGCGKPTQAWLSAMEERVGRRAESEKENRD